MGSVQHAMGKSIWGSSNAAQNCEWVIAALALLESVNAICRLRCINCTTHIAVIYKLAESVLDPTVYVIDEDIKEHQFQDRARRDTICHQPPPGHRAIDHKSLAASIQPIPYPLNSPLLKPMSVQFRDKDVIWDHVKSLTEV
ncbi:hypothetical protein HGM15179_019012 [Zosterops borbonicus]|uniref:Uncharacterized protein n=1 Tax=Zosterops borbonicus TaxID=364589 RepID=A0A8K1FW90_9PASS|nr:hypothetical protein HGM15179_019012 [Zosterops borbonicus]